MSSAVLKLSKSEIQKLKTYYTDYLLNKKVPYSDFSAKKNGISITAYTSGKVLFQGNNAEQEAARWGNATGSPAKKAAIYPKTLPRFPFSVAMKLVMAATLVRYVSARPMRTKNSLPC